jgi:hypothetical protein
LTFPETLQASSTTRSWSTYVTSSTTPTSPHAVSFQQDLDYLQPLWASSHSGFPFNTHPPIPATCSDPMAFSSSRQLETLVIDFALCFYDVERPSLVCDPRCYRLRRSASSSDHHPSLEKLGIYFFELRFPSCVSCSLETQRRKLRSSSAKFQFFNKKVVVVVYLREDSEARTYALSIHIRCLHLDCRYLLWLKISMRSAEKFLR